MLHPDQRLTIGRKVADLVIDSDMISSRHAALWFQDGRWMVQDLESSSGTFVDEVSTGSSAAPLPPGCTLRAGGVRFQVTYGAPDAQPSLPLRPAPASNPAQPSLPLRPAPASTPVQGAPPAPLETTYRVRLPGGAIWTVAREDYVELIDPYHLSDRPFWPPNGAGEIDLRDATPAQMKEMVETAALEARRTQLRPSTYFVSILELDRLLSADPRVRWYLGTPPPTDEEVRNERTRERYAEVFVRAEARLHRADPSYRLTPADDVKLPRDLGSSCSSECFFAAQKLDDTTAPAQSDVDRVADLLAGTIESHVVWAMRGDGAAQWGGNWAAEGHSGLPRLVGRFLARHRPSEPAMRRLRLAILVMSEALKVGIHFYDRDDEVGTRNVTVWFDLFHDLASGMPAA